MPARRYQATGDPRLKSPQWRAIVKHWRTLQLPDCQATRCLLPGIPIRYTGPRGPASLDVGHKLGRHLDTRSTWTIEDTRPEHQRCNRSAGQAVTTSKQRARERNTALNNTQPATARFW